LGSSVEPIIPSDQVCSVKLQIPYCIKESNQEKKQRAIILQGAIEKNAIAILEKYMIG
jgi:hypothetical protein